MKNTVINNNEQMNPMTDKAVDSEALSYRMKISSGINAVEANLSSIQARNRFLVYYRLQHKDVRFSYNLFGKSWEVGDRRLSYKEYKKLSDTYDFPSMILEIIDERYSGRIEQAREAACRIFNECEAI